MHNGPRESANLHPAAVVCVYKATNVPATYKSGQRSADQCLAWRFNANVSDKSSIGSGSIEELPGFGRVGHRLANGKLGVSPRVIFCTWANESPQHGQQYTVVAWGGYGWNTVLKKKTFTARGGTNEVYW